MQRWYVVALIVGGVLAVAAGATVFAALNAARSEAPPPVEVQRVVIAREAVTSGTIVSAANVQTLFETTRLPTTMVPADAVTTLTGLEGRRVASNLAKGEVVLTGQLVQATALSLGPSVVPPNSVVITIPVSEQTALGIPIRPSDKVDLVVTLTVRQTDGGQRTVTQVLLKDVPVVAVNGETALPTASGPASLVPSKPISSLTAAVSPQEALEIRHLLNSSVRLDVIPRRPDDASSAGTTPVTTDAIIRRLGLPQVQVP